MTPVPHIQAWIYPGPPSCSASTELADGRTIDTLKPGYYNLSDTGALTQITSGCNSYSAANAALIKAHSKQQFVTISGSIAGITALNTSKALMTTSTSILVAFLTTTGFTGVEWDIEGFSDWTPAQYGDYKAVMAAMGQVLHTHGFQLMIDGPAIINPTYQGYYLNFRYEDFEKLPIDKIVIMCYDFQNDNGNGTPVATLSDLTGCCQWMKPRISDPGRVVIGVNSYGYHGETSGPAAYTSTADTYQQSMKYPGFSTARRDASSGEMLWSSGDKSYSYSDSTTLNLKVQTVLSAGYSQMSIWHLGGGNAYPTQSAQSPALSPTPEVATPSDSTLDAFNTAYPGFASWYAEHFDAQGKYLG